jgi:hypothetical protein
MPLFNDNEKWKRLVFGIIIVLIICFFILSGFMLNATVEHQKYFGYGMIAITVVVGILGGILIGPYIDERINKKKCEFYDRKYKACEAAKKTDI